MVFSASWLHLWKFFNLAVLNFSQRAKKFRWTWMFDLKIFNPSYQRYKFFLHWCNGKRNYCQRIKILQKKIVFDTNNFFMQYQNSNSWNCQQTEWNIKLTAQKVRRSYKWHNIYKRGHGWTNVKKIESDCNCDFWKLVSLTVLKFIFVVCNVWFHAKVISQVP